MTDTATNIQDEMNFKSINIRNLGSMYMDNGMRKHILTGNYLQVYPGGLLNAKNLQINAETVIVDVLGEIRADYNGYCSGGLLPLFTFCNIFLCKSTSMWVKQAQFFLNKCQDNTLDRPFIGMNSFLH